MRIEPINTGNRIYYLSRLKPLIKKDVLKKYYEKLKEPYRVITINLTFPNKLHEYRAKKIYKDFMENINKNLDDFVNELRRQISPYSNYITIGNLVDTSI